MTLEQTIEWIGLHKLELGIILFIIIVAVYKFTKKLKERKMAKKDVPPEPPKETPIDVDSLYLEKDFADANMMELSNLEHLRNMRDLVRKDIKEKKEMYRKAKKRYVEVIEIWKKLKVHIPLLQEQEKVFDEKIAELEGKGKEGK